MSINFLDSILGKTKLTKEIEKLQEKICFLERELKEKEYVIQDLYGNNEELKDEKKLINNMLRKQGKELKQNIEYITIKEKELLQTQAIINHYQSYYGVMTYENIKEEQMISDFDEDKGFFEFLKPKNDNNDFNREQVEAIRYNMQNNLRIIAGAGSGKTQTICAKAAYLVMMKDIPEEKVAMVTFTKKAAEEMRERVISFLEEERTRVAIGTFHSFFKKLYDELKKRFPYVETIGVNGGKVDERKYNIKLKELIKKYGLRKLDEDAGEKNLNEKISYWTNMGFSLKEMTEHIEKHFDLLDSTNKESLSQRFYQMMLEFNEIRKKNNIVVFDDYMINLLHVLENDKEAREYIQQRFSYIFIDEFQDTNPLQMKIIQLICPNDKEDVAKLIIVGDDDQSIYYFRGAQPKYIKEFDQIYETHTLTLMTNYRSTAKIVQAGNRVITYNAEDRIQKSMEPFHKSEGDCFIQPLSNPEKEAEWIINRAQRIGLNHNDVEKEWSPDYTKSVVLYRSATQIKTFLYELEAQNIPFVIEANDDLMGIFSLDVFKRAYRYWSRFYNEEVNKRAQWNNIIAETSYAFYKKKQEVANFIGNGSLYLNPKKVADFICENKNSDKKALVIEYLEDLVKLKNKKPVSISGIINKLLKFPVSENQLTADEIKWIEKETSQFSSWEDVAKRFNELDKKKKEMTSKLEKYHDGTYNALYLLTIHKSKGLSFPNVFLIGVYDEGLPSKRATKVTSTVLKESIEKAEPPTTIEEERRLMYGAKRWCEIV
ncbi:MULTISPECIES: ATP-dependent helicase [Bacillus]|uniref:ATP-dependent helicase n=1 Tax=Bacillus TaxID=1386 RepID=UPI001E285C40|nr:MULTISPECIES: ATP-dependent helicase [Bacillus]MCM0004567.1 ATP-dependent helicase [Bacillus paranthracis]MDA1955070.1 ATP-dependent helicase [Bacillus cereus group sp. BcHK114]